MPSRHSLRPGKPVDVSTTVCAAHRAYHIIPQAPAGGKEIPDLRQLGAAYPGLGDSPCGLASGAGVAKRAAAATVAPTRVYSKKTHFTAHLGIGPYGSLNPRFWAVRDNQGPEC